ncbi:hypothetical protein ABFB09_09145 [Dehalogenimonas sp. THU2]|uniref:hypothetical protein n=1 Tax=Dehalogenimonas sp. THU2 TaxID=3151121 RepID=UPI0032185F32
MKRFYGLIITGLVLLTVSAPVIASTVTGALYKAAITATNTSYTAQNVSVPFTLSTQGLLDGAYINSNFTNVAMQNAAGEDVAFMPGQDGDPWMFFIPQIGQNSAANYNLYTGGTTAMGGAIAYFPGAGGMTVPDDASLELGDDFEIEVSGYVDTSVAGDIVAKDSAFTLASDGAGSVTASITSASSPTKGTTTNSYNPDSLSTHSITMPSGVESGDMLIVLVTVNYSVAGITLTFPAGWNQIYAENVGGANVSGYAYYKVSDGSEGASISVNASTSCLLGSQAYRIDNGGGIPTATISTTGSPGTSPNPPSHTAGTNDNVWLAVTHYQNPSYNVTGYPSGYTSISQGLGGSPAASIKVASGYKTSTNYTEDPGAFSATGSINFVTTTIAIGPSSTIITTSSSVSSGEHILKVTADTTNLKLYVDGVEEDSTALAGASVPDNANDWVMFANNVMPYVYYVKITVGGTLVGHWYWEYDTTFTDQSGNGNDATPTFRTTTTDADVTAVIKSYGAANQSVFDSGSEDAAPDIVSDDDIPAVFSMFYVDLHAEDLPGIGTAINDYLDNQSIPQEIVWLPFVYLGGAVITMIGYRYTRKLMPSAFAGIIWNVFFGVVIGSGLWGLVPIGVVTLGEMANRKKVSI